MLTAASEDPSAVSVAKIRAYFHHMKLEERKVFSGIDIDVPLHAEYSSTMTLGSFIARVTKRGHDEYLSCKDELPQPNTEQDRLRNMHIFNAPLDNKAFVDKFAAPNPTFAKYTDPEQYTIKVKKSTTYLIDTQKALTEVKSFAEVLACKLLTKLNDPTTFHTTAFVLHNIFRGLIAKDAFPPAGKVRGGVSYSNGTSVFNGSGVKFRPVYCVNETKKMMKFNADEIMRGVNAKGESLCNKVTGLVPYAGCISANGCHYHVDSSGCPYTSPTQEYSSEVDCTCGRLKAGLCHYDEDVTGAGFAECNCTFVVPFTASKFCEVGIRESRYLARSAQACDPAVVPEKLIGKAFGPFGRTVSEEDSKHLVTYDMIDHISRGKGFIKKLNELTPAFKKLSEPSIVSLHRHGDKGLATPKDRIAQMTVSALGWQANYNIQLKPCVMYSQTGYSVKFEIHHLIANGVPVASGGIFTEATGTFEEDEEEVPRQVKVSSSPPPAATPKFARKPAKDTPSEREISSDNFEGDDLDDL